MGKFDKRFKEIIASFKELGVERGTLGCYFDSFITVRDVFFERARVHKFAISQNLTANSIMQQSECSNICYTMISKLHIMINNVKTLLCESLSISQQDVVDICWKLYLSKNSQYGDAWYMNGSFGVFYDLHRKSVRLYEMALTSQITGEKLSSNSSFENTIIDTINYCTMLIIAIESCEIHLFEATGACIFEMRNFDDVEI